MQPRDQPAVVLVTRVERRHERPDRSPDRQPARVARMLALAHHIEAGLDAGRWPSASHVARILGLSRNRLSQVLTLTTLAPDLQRQVLALVAVDGLEPMTERWLFESVVNRSAWCDQHRAWIARRPCGTAACG